MLSEELEEFKRQLRRFVDRELIPLEGELPLSAERKAELQNKAKAAGFWLLDVPESDGGQGVSLLAMSLFWQEISRSVTVPSRDHSIFGPAVGPILLSLGGEQREKYLTPVLAEKRRSCFAQTEPDAGSDPASMRTRAVRDGKGYRLTGTKRFITGAREADFAQVIAVTDPKKGSRDSMSCFLVEMDTPGVDITVDYETMMGDRPSEIVFNDAYVPAENLVGSEGDGFRLAQKWINHGRIRHGSRACGVAERCLDLTVSYVKQRKTFGDSLARRQGVQWILADCFIELHAATLMVREAAARLDREEDARRETYMVKIFGDEMGFRVADRCLQLHGGIGLTTDLPIEKFWRDQRSFMITEGPSEVLRTALAKHILRQ
jgi:acyl-CoA dehydrogenase